MKTKSHLFHIAPDCFFFCSGDLGFARGGHRRDIHGTAAWYACDENNSDIVCFEDGI